MHHVYNKEMKKTYRIIFLFASMGIYILLAFIEFFMLNNLFDIFTSRYLYHEIMMLICLLIINPIITYILVNLIPLKPKKRIKDNITEEMRQER